MEFPEPLEILFMRTRFGRQNAGVSFFAFQDIITGTSGFLIVLTLFLALNLDEVHTEGPHTEALAKREGDLKSMQATIRSLKKEVADLQNRPADDEATLKRMIGQMESTIATLDAEMKPGLDRDFDATARDRELKVTKDKLLTKLEHMNASLHEAELLSSGINKDIPDLENKVLNVQSSLQRIRSRDKVITLIPERDGFKRQPLLVLVQGSLILLQRPDGSPASGSTADFVKYLQGASPKTHFVVFYFKPSGANHFESLTKRARQEGYSIGYDVIPEDAEVEFLKEGGKP
ncbi:MAG: hypothetical protein RL015_1814 [Verrucomicrobiota bacterium]|jgi:hypothetical protein